MSWRFRISKRTFAHSDGLDSHIKVSYTKSYSSSIRFLSLSNARVITRTTAGRFFANSVRISPYDAFFTWCISHATFAISHCTAGLSARTSQPASANLTNDGASVITRTSFSIDSSEAGLTAFFVSLALLEYFAFSIAIYLSC